MPRRPSRIVVALVVIALWTLPGPGGAQLAPLPHERGATGLGLALRRLPVGARVLYVTAHPDDEHNGILVRLARGLGVRTALLTLTRGDGGQNYIGPELFDALAVLRTEELLALHRYDGVEQYFGRASDFGFSFSVEETLEKWGHEETLGDVVRVVRSFRPDVILTLPLEAPGGGQHHQAAARLAREAFRVAADSARFPEQIQAGLRPWQARKIYQGGTGGFGEKIEGRPVHVPTGVPDPLLGLTWQEFGSLGRAFHRSQGAGQFKADPGPAEGVYYLIDSKPGIAGLETDILDGVDLSVRDWRRFAAGHEGALPSLAGDLEALQRSLEAARSAFDAAALDKPIPALDESGTLLRRLRARAQGSTLPPAVRDELSERLTAKEGELFAALGLAQGVVFELTADGGQVVPGQAFTATARVWNQSGGSATVEGLTLSVPDGWTVASPLAEREVLPPAGRLLHKFTVTVGASARLSQPYWKHGSRPGRFDLEIPADETLPWSPPSVTGTLRYTAHSVTTTQRALAIYRYEGPFVGGEKQHVVQVVPRLSVRLSPEVAVVPLGPPRQPREFRVVVTHNAKGEASAVARLDAPAGWSSTPREAPLRFRYEGEEIAARFLVTPPALVEEGVASVRAVVAQGGREFREGIQVVAYPHTERRHLVTAAAARLLTLDVRTAPGVSIGYVMGPGDAVADAIRQLGVPLALLGPDDLADQDLSRYSTIVTGIRAYEVRNDLRSYHPRLMRWVEAGGNLVVLYNRASFNWLAPPLRPGAADAGAPKSPFAPYPAAVTSNRISDETAPLTILVPESPLFTTPNRIGPRDWEGWVQERGMQLLDARDPRYVQLLAGADPFPKNPGEQKGLLVEARVGRGTWTYVGLALFRQLPAGTPGAYRLLANLISRPRRRS